MKVLSYGIEENTTIPARYTCDGPGMSPEITWQQIPEGTQTIALIMDDPDAPGGTFTHWLVWNIPADTSRLQSNLPRKAELPNGIRQGVNSGGTYGYYPPCPPSGPTHRYIFRLMALDNIPDITGGASREQFEQALSGHILKEASITGLYSR